MTTSKGRSSSNHLPPDDALAPGFRFLKFNDRGSKPRKRGVTEIRGSYYSFVGEHYLADLLGAMGQYVDTLKFAGGSFSIMPRRSLRSIIEVCHRHDVHVSTGGFIEYVLTHGSRAVDRYFAECRDFGFDIVEISAGFVSLPTDDWLRLIEKVLASGMRAKPEVGIQFGAGGGATSAAELEAEGQLDPSIAIDRARRFLEAGADMIMVESEGISENVRRFRTDVPARFVGALGIDRLMFEAADPEVFTWYVKTFGADVNLFVDHTQIVQLECLRQGIWGTKSTWGRVQGYRG